MYKDDIKKLSRFTIGGMLEAARRNVPSTCFHEPWKHPELNHGKGLLQSEGALDSYIAAYGEAHVLKAQHGIKFLPLTEIREHFEICDWGCGQGIGSICLLQELAKRNLLGKLRKIRLIEPSAAALERAVFNIGQIVPDIAIEPINKGLPSEKAPFECVREISFEEPVTIHFFSNILDINGINLKEVADLIASSGHRHYVLCIGPANLNEDRINAFCRNFDPKYVNFLQRFKETQFFRNTHYNNHSFSCFIRIFRFDTTNPVLIPYEFYAPKQFFAAYQSDILPQIFRDKSVGELECAFDVMAPFDIGASIYDDPNPVLAVLNNIIVRGLPTRLSPWIERMLAEEFRISHEFEKLGSIGFTLIKDNPHEEKAQLIRLIPLGVARIQKVIIEALLTGRLELSEKWRVLVHENDVPCSAMAIRELGNMFNHLTGASRDYDRLRFPEIELTVINAQYPMSGLHLDANVKSTADRSVTDPEYDLVIDISLLEQSEPTKVKFSKYRARKQCYFNVRNSVEIYDERHIYTTSRIVYKPLTNILPQGTHENIEENAAHLRYFLRLLFRKQDFRPGQLPIISRALQLKSVIGLLPTGAGKSLTYQLAAFMQPGIAIVIDPLISLMKDQYDGLLKNGIDVATFINSSVQDKAARENAMKESEKLFVFLSPERLTIDDFRKSLRDMADNHVYFSYGVIDEVHCVSEWGHDFRFSYLHLGKNLYSYVLPRQTDDKELNHITLFGLTATASFDVLADVERELSGNSAFPLDAQSTVRYENTNRLELQYRVVKINGSRRQPSKWDIYSAKNESVPGIIRDVCALSMRELSEPDSIRRIKEKFIERENIDADSNYAHEIENAEIVVDVDDKWYAKKEAKASAIVFCPHRSGSLGVNDGAYQRGIASTIRETLEIDGVSRFCGGDTLMAQDEFIDGKSGIMVATKAFGMGIDKPNVRFTLNVNHSGSLEAYVQEAGRAGRDRKMALSVILYSDCEVMDKNAGEALPVDYGVHKFFYDGNFIGPDFEKRIIYHLMAFHNTLVLDRESGRQMAARGFLSSLENAKTGEECVSYISFRYPSPDSDALDNALRHNGLPTVGADVKDEKTRGNKYFEVLMKAIYRMCCIGLIEDFTVDYRSKQFRITSKKLEEGGYYEALKSFLMRYYSENRAEQEVESAKNYRGKEEIYKCLGYLIDFVYHGIAVKRERAIKDIEDFCRNAANSPKNWLEVNEELKDYLYFYFNSKYARPEYLAPNDEPFSLVDDTNQGKEFDPAHIRKYMRVIDDEIVDVGTPKDNVKHLLGAVRLIRRALTDTNPTLDFLNLFCMLYLKPERDAPLNDEMKESYLNGYIDYRKRSSEVESFYSDINGYKQRLRSQEIVGPEQLAELEELDIVAEGSLHTDWLTSFAQRFNN